MNGKIRRLLIIATFSGISFIGISIGKKVTLAQNDSNTNKRPNIVIILVDDLGYSDLAMYGGEVPTPNIDSLAKSGMMFTNFHTAPTCSPSRAMLLSGVDNHRDGLGNMEELLTPAQKNKPGYEGYLNKQIVPLPQMLKDAGYHTYMAGKWHLGKEPGYHPADRGFEQSYAMLQGGGSHFNLLGELPNSTLTFLDNDRPAKTLVTNYYSSQFYTDKLIEYIDKNKGDGKPFFAYAAYQAVHEPLQAPDEYINKYIGKYDIGWDKLRQQRFNRQKQLGLIPDYLPYPARWPMVPAWNSLTPEKQKYNAKIMAVYSAMLDDLDHHIGRLIDHLKEIGQYDNTVFVFMSDNGASGLDFYENDKPSYDAWFKNVGISNTYDNIGKVNSYISLGLNWAEVSTTPLLWSKAREAEGGTRVPAIVSYPRGGVMPGMRTETFAHELDIVPTLLGYAGVNIPGDTYNGRPFIPLDGHSMRPLLEGKTDHIYKANEAIGQEVFGTGNNALVLGDWKILLLAPPWGDNKWHLYNLRMDPRELNDLAGVYPEQLKKMVALYDKYAKEKGIVPAGTNNPGV